MMFGFRRHSGYAQRWLERVVSLAWSGDDVRMTTGGFGAITVAMKVLAGPTPPCATARLPPTSGAMPA
ncbi:hypothetical protein [Terrabacter terrigena]|uniref:Uncharacterized protein n=1 Tax=Terrabacter terrigena TaxID=574718 RepID=A0ABW3N446_9MICO